MELRNKETKIMFQLKITKNVIFFKNKSAFI